MPNVKKIRGLNRPGMPWACPGMLRDDLYLYLQEKVRGRDWFTSVLIVYNWLFLSMSRVHYNYQSSHYYRAVCLIVFLWLSWSLLDDMVTANLQSLRVTLLLSAVGKLKERTTL